MNPSITPTAAEPPLDEVHPHSLLRTIGEHWDDFLSFDDLLGVAIWLVVLWFVLAAYRRMAVFLAKRGVDRNGTLNGAYPMVRLAGLTMAGFILLAAVTPDEPVAFALIIGGTGAVVIWASRDALRNALSGIIVIASRAVRIGDHITIDEHQGIIKATSLRGILLEAPDGARTWVPNTRFHTGTITHAPGGIKSRPTTIRIALPPSMRNQGPAQLRSAALRLGQISPRRALGTPVLVALTDSADAVLITLTPFDPAEAEPLEAELTQRLHDAYQDKTAEIGTEAAAGSTAES